MLHLVPQLLQRRTHSGVVAAAQLPKNASCAAVVSGAAMLGAEVACVWRSLRLNLGRANRGPKNRWQIPKYKLVVFSSSEELPASNGAQMAHTTATTTVFSQHARPSAFCSPMHTSTHFTNTVAAPACSAGLLRSQCNPHQQQKTRCSSPQGAPCRSGLPLARKSVESSQPAHHTRSPPRAGLPSVPVLIASPQHRRPPSSCRGSDRQCWSVRHQLTLPQPSSLPAST